MTKANRYRIIWRHTDDSETGGSAPTLTEALCAARELKPRNVNRVTITCKGKIVHREFLESCTC